MDTVTYGHLKIYMVQLHHVVQINREYHFIKQTFQGIKLFFITKRFFQPKGLLNIFFDGTPRPDRFKWNIRYGELDRPNLKLNPLRTPDSWKLKFNIVEICRKSLKFWISVKVQDSNWGCLACKTNSLSWHYF